MFESITKPLRKFFWKRRHLRTLAGDAFLKEATALYSEETIKDILFLKQADLDQKANLEAKLASIGEGTEYEKRKERTEVEKEIEEVETKIKGRDRAAEAMQRQAATLRNQAEELWSRRRVFKEKF